MRRVGPGVVVAACLALAPGCHREAPPPVVAPDERPPLPPASGTPVGYLLDADDLKLRDDQRADLEAIDEDLAARLDVLAGADRGGRPAPAAGGSSARRRGGGRRGGMAGGGRRGGMASPGAGSGSPAGPRVRRGPAAAPGPALGAGRDGDTRAAEIRAALARALARLDTDQQVIARRVLAARGVEIEPGGQQTAAPTAGAEAGAGALNEDDAPAPGEGSAR